jgi:hypothetical protein
MLKNLEYGLQVRQLVEGDWGTDYAACRDEYAEMFENVTDFESGEGPWE